MWNHWVVRASSPYKPFNHFESARRTWFGIQDLFPELISAVLMPNHLHVILPKSARFIHPISGLLSGISRREKLKKLWQPIPEPSHISDLFHLRRQVRYVALNPCRKKLCADPLEWHWSTYREVMGATLEQRNATQLAQILGESNKNFKVRFHAYVSGDPSVSVGGTPFPHLAVPKAWATESIGAILDSASSALRLQPREIQNNSALRALFVHSAYRHGWKQPQLLAQMCGISPRAIRLILKRPTPLGIEAVDLCLGDIRLRKFPKEGSKSPELPDFDASTSLYR